MPASQRLLFPDPRPLVERLGLDFFRQLPGCPGVYLMKDAAQGVLYVGKAKNLRQRLAGLAPLSGLALRGRIHGMGDRQDAPNRVAGVWRGGTAVALC